MSSEKEHDQSINRERRLLSLRLRGFDSLNGNSITGYGNQEEKTSSSAHTDRETKILRSKICSKCGTEKSIENYYKRKDSKDGYYQQCKQCIIDRTKPYGIIYRSLHRQKYRDYLKEYRKTHLEQFNKYHKHRLRKRPKSFWRRYAAIHKWARNRIHNDGICTICNREGLKLEIANISGRYWKHFSDWFWLCRECHYLYDKLNKTHIGGGKPEFYK